VKKNKNFKVIATVVVLFFLAASLMIMIGCGGGGDGGGGSSNLGTIMGTVYDSNGYTVSGALVSWKLASTASAKQSSTYTDSSGNFTLSDVTPGTVLVTATSYYEAYHVEVLVTADTTTEVLMDLTPSGTVQGTITDSSTGSYLYGALASITFSDGVTLMDSTDTSGFYQIPNVYTGTQTVYITLSGYYTSSASVSVSEGSTTSQSFALTPTTQPTPTPTPTPSPTVTPTPGAYVYAVFVGINDYPGSDSDLDYCVADATGMRSNFENSTMWSGASITTLTNSDATESAIGNAITYVKNNADSDDLFVFYFSGHGTNSVGNAALVTWDTTGNFAYITDSELETLISGMPCPTAIYLDSCYSGGMIGKKVQKTVKGDVLTGKVYTKAPGYDPKFKGGFLQGMKSVASLNNLVGISASSGTEISWESSSLQHGVFTYYTMEGLGTGSTIGPADTNSSGNISAEESYSYTSPKVQSYSGGDQNPQMTDNYPTSTDNSAELVVKQ